MQELHRQKTCILRAHWIDQQRGNQRRKAATKYFLLTHPPWLQSYSIKWHLQLPSFKCREVVMWDQTNIKNSNAVVWLLPQITMQTSCRKAVAGQYPQLQPVLIPLPPANLPSHCSSTVTKHHDAYHLQLPYFSNKHLNLIFNTRCFIMHRVRDNAPALATLVRLRYRATPS